MHASLSKRLKEGAFLLLLAIGVYFLMALFSYSPDDPSWVFESAKQHADNAGGVAGAWAASVLLMLFGKVAYVFPLMIAWGGWLMFRERSAQQHSVYLRIARWAGFILTVLSAAALASLHFGGAEDLPEGSGGITGDLISSSGQAVLNSAGASLLLLALLLVGFTLFTGVSWLGLMDSIGGFVLNAWRQAVTLVGSLGERRAASRMKQERQEVVKKEKARKRNSPPPVIEKKEPTIKQSERVEKEKQMTLLQVEPNTELPPLGSARPSPEERQGPVDRCAAGPVGAGRAKARRLRGDCRSHRSPSGAGGHLVRDPALGRDQGEQGHEPVERPGARAIDRIGAGSRSDSGQDRDRPGDTQRIP